MPKGEVTHDELSQLLFVYIGIASDIMELLVLFEEDYVIQDEFLTYIILGIWSLSLFQFALVLTVTKGSKHRAVGITRTVKESYYQEGEQEDKKACKCCETEVWSILTAMMMQDAPFLAIRLYVMIKNQNLSYSILFFTFKNFLIISMQFYRLGVVIGLHCTKKKRKETQNNDLPTDMEIGISEVVDNMENGSATDKDSSSPKTPESPNNTNIDHKAIDNGSIIPSSPMNSTG